VGHDLSADISFLQKVGYNVHNLSNLQETADTASMWRYIKRDINPRSLGSILAELDITGWNLHNAGNDAAYTLQAMIKIAIKHLQDREKDKNSKEQEIKDRIAEYVSFPLFDFVIDTGRSVKEATMAAWEREQGWSSSGENSDGGAPVIPAPKPAPPKKPSWYANSNYSNNGPWKQNVPPQQTSSKTQFKSYNKQNTWGENFAAAYKPKVASRGQPGDSVPANHNSPRFLTPGGKDGLQLREGTSNESGWGGNDSKN
jgi:hypothetical protein